LVQGIWTAVMVTKALPCYELWLSVSREKAPGVHWANNSITVIELL
jgi:hypothetical protein